MAVLLLSMVSGLVFVIQLLVFRSPRDTAFYFLQDLAFLPIQVAIVTVVLGKILNDREKRERLKKTNMMVGAFFSELGDGLIDQLHKMKIGSEELAPNLKFKENWSLREFESAVAAIEGYHLEISCTALDFAKLKAMLSEKRPFLLLMLSNPNLLEHESFTDLLWAIFHLTDELLARESLEELPQSDAAHLNNDVKRAFNAMLSVWLIYMAHLKTDYPYLFSLELRRNPFGEGKISVT